MQTRETTVAAGGYNSQNALSPQRSTPSSLIWQVIDTLPILVLWYMAQLAL